MWIHDNNFNRQQNTGFFQDFFIIVSVSLVISNVIYFWCLCQWSNSICVYVCAFLCVCKIVIVSIRVIVWACCFHVIMNLLKNATFVTRYICCIELYVCTCHLLSITYLLLLLLSRVTWLLIWSTINKCFARVCMRNQVLVYFHCDNW